MYFHQLKMDIKVIIQTKNFHLSPLLSLILLFLSKLDSDRFYNCCVRFLLVDQPYYKNLSAMRIPLLLALLIIGISTQITAILETSPQQTMINNGVVADNFNFNPSLFDCSLPSIYTDTQTSQQLSNNSPTPITITTTDSLTISLSTRYGLLQPHLSSSQCLPPGCTIDVISNCQQPIHYQNYFDIFILTFASSGQTLTTSYFLYCDPNFSPNTLEWGLIVEIFLTTILIYVVAIYSNPWSLGGRALEVTVWLVLLFVGLLGLGVLVAAFSDQGIMVCLYILSFALGIFGVAICTNQLLFLFKSKKLKRRLLHLFGFDFRILQCISLIVGILVSLGWYLSDSNIFLNNILSICSCVALIKVLKFTNLKIAGITFLVTISLQLIIVIMIYVIRQQSYNNLFLNKYNFPVQLQFPTLNATYNQKCAWLPITAIVFPGLLLSYLRRFDTSRNTRVYLITATVNFLVGGVAWVFVNVPSPVTFPFGLISQPCMFGLVCLFAYQRKEIRVIWSGEFYDQQFANREETRKMIEMIDEGPVERRSTIGKQLIEAIKIEQSMNSRISDVDVVRSKFLKF